MIRTTLLSLAVSALALTAAAATLSKEDRDFLDNAAQGGLVEVRLGEIAVKQAGSDDVKKFGQRMIDDHTKLDARIGDVAHDEGVILPAEPTKAQQQEIDKLSQLAGPKFDKEYMTRMVDDHEHDVKAFEKEAKDAKDPAVKQLASTALPTLHEHLDLSRQILERIKK
jgi:putative membrane protein